MDAGDILAPARVVPVVVLDDAEQAVPLARTLYSAGLRFVEITLRTPAALAGIERMTAAVSGLCVGAGSVLTAAQLADAEAAGARFAVSPGSSEALLAAAQHHRLPLVPGAATATEIMALLARGYRLQKFFPAERAGGCAMLKAFGGPLRDARFFPTGGITPALAPDYLALANVACIGGTWLTPAKALAGGDFEHIGQLAGAAAALA